MSAGSFAHYSITSTFAQIAGYTATADDSWLSEQLQNRPWEYALQVDISAWCISCAIHYRWRSCFRRSHFRMSTVREALSVVLIAVASTLLTLQGCLATRFIRPLSKTFYLTSYTVWHWVWLRLGFLNLHLRIEENWVDMHRYHMQYCRLRFASINPWWGYTLCQLKDSIIGSVGYVFGWANWSEPLLAICEVVRMCTAGCGYGLCISLSACHPSCSSYHTERLREIVIII